MIKILEGTRETVSFEESSAFMFFNNDEVSDIMHCSEWQATMGKMIGALNYFGFEHSEEIIYTLGKPDVKLPKCCIMMEKMGRYNHYLIGYDGKYYDSSAGVLEEYDFTKLTGYLEVLVD